MKCFSDVFSTVMPGCAHGLTVLGKSLHCSGQPDDIYVLNFDFVTLEPGNFTKQNSYFFLNRQFKYNGLPNPIATTYWSRSVQMYSRASHRYSGWKKSSTYQQCQQFQNRLTWQIGLQCGHCKSDNWCSNKKPNKLNFVFLISRLQIIGSSKLSCGIDTVLMISAMEPRYKENEI